jgi:hypothetical protein
MSDIWFGKVFYDIAVNDHYLLGCDSKKKIMLNLKKLISFYDAHWVCANIFEMFFNGFCKRGVRSNGIEK